MFTTVTIKIFTKNSCKKIKNLLSNNFLIKNTNIFYFLLKNLNKNNRYIYNLNKIIYYFFKQKISKKYPLFKYKELILQNIIIEKKKPLKRILFGSKGNFFNKYKKNSLVHLILKKKNNKTNDLNKLYKGKNKNIVYNSYI